MVFGTCMIIGSIISILDNLLERKYKGFFIAALIFILAGAGMMISYREPNGAYQITDAKDQESLEKLQDLKQQWHY